MNILDRLFRKKQQDTRPEAPENSAYRCVHWPKTEGEDRESYTKRLHNWAADPDSEPDIERWHKEHTAFEKRKKDSPPPPVKGDIAYFGLTDWWLSAFTEKERKHIIRKHHPYGDPDSLTKGDLVCSTANSAKILWGLASWFHDEKDRYLSYIILAKAEEEAIKDDLIVELHCTYTELIRRRYEERDKLPDGKDNLIDACRKQISIAEQVAIEWIKEPWMHALPEHYGFDKLSLIMEKDGPLEEAISLCKEAERQGWTCSYGTWEGRVKRCRLRMLISRDFSEDDLYGFNGSDLCSVADELFRQHKESLASQPGDKIVMLCEAAIREGALNMARAFRLIGEVYEARGDIVKAVGNYESALSIDPNVGVKKRLEKLRIKILDTV